MISISPNVKALLFNVDFLTRIINGEEIDESNTDQCTAKYILQNLDTLNAGFTEEDIKQIRNSLKNLLK